MKSIIISFLLLVTASIGCKDNGNNKPQVKAKQNDSLPKDSVVIENTNNNYNDVALFLAGYMPQKDSGLIRLTKDSIWIKHSALLNNGFNAIENNRFKYMKAWRDTELKEANESQVKTLYYPLSGPDILNGYILFPKCENFILVALEPAGKIKDMPKMKTKDFAGYISHLDKSMQDIFRRSYFITSAMSGDFSKWKVDGNLPVMLVFLARTGNTIQNIKRIAIDSTGALKEFNLNQTVPASYLSKGVRIDFVNKDQPGVNKHVYYFSMNLGDEEFNSMTGLDKNKGFMTWIYNQGDMVSYMKAASYLHHYGFFGRARKIVFDKSKVHVQDDSGIAYNFFDKKKWKFKLYGEYSHPIRDFGKIYEKDLELAYKKDSANVKPVPFKLGYHYSSKVNMMIAVKQ